jgi:hypothetical protein
VEVLRFCQGTPTGNSLTGGVNRSDRCSLVAARVCFFAAFSGRLWWVLVLVNFLSPGSRDMFDANNKAVNYLFHALC